MTSKECIEILRTMAIGASRTEKEAIEFAIKKIKQAKKWKRKARIEFIRGYDDGYDMGYRDGLNYDQMRKESHADRSD